MRSQISNRKERTKYVREKRRKAKDSVNHGKLLKKSKRKSRPETSVQKAQAANKGTQDIEK